MQITDIQHKENERVPTHPSGHSCISQKHCSQISVSIYTHLKNKGHFNSAH